MGENIIYTILESLFYLFGSWLWWWIRWIRWMVLEISHCHVWWPEGWWYPWENYKNGGNGGLHCHVSLLADKRNHWKKNMLSLLNNPWELETERTDTTSRRTATVITVDCLWEVTGPPKGCVHTGTAHGRMMLQLKHGLSDGHGKSQGKISSFLVEMS